MNYYTIPQTDVDSLTLDLIDELSDRFRYAEINESMFYSIQSYLVAWRLAVRTNVYDLRDINIKANFARFGKTGVSTIEVTYLFFDEEPETRLISLK